MWTLYRKPPQFGVWREPSAAVLRQTLPSLVLQSLQRLPIAMAFFAISALAVTVVFFFWQSFVAAEMSGRGLSMDICNLCKRVYACVPACMHVCTYV